MAGIKPVHRVRFPGLIEDDVTDLQGQVAATQPPASISQRHYGQKVCAKYCCQSTGVLAGRSCGAVRPAAAEIS